MIQKSHKTPRQAATSAHSKSSSRSSLAQSATKTSVTKSSTAKTTTKTAAKTAAKTSTTKKSTTKAPITSTSSTAKQSSKSVKESVDNVISTSTLNEDLANFATAKSIPIENTSENKQANAAALDALKDDSELDSASPIKPAKKKSRIVPKLISLIATVAVGCLAYLIIRANVLPVLHLSLLVAVMAVYCLFAIFKAFRPKTHTPVIIILTIINVILTGVSVFGSFKLNDTLNFFSRTLGTSDTAVNLYDVIVRKTSSKSKLSDVSGQIIHAQRDLTIGNDAITKAIADQAKATVAFADDLDYLIGLITGQNVADQEKDKCAQITDDSSDEDYSANIVNCYYSAYQNETDPIILIHSNTYDDITSENSALADQTKVIGTIKIESKVQQIELDNITTKPFLIYLSGIDTRTNSMPERSLSDVNMVAVVNPVTRHLLLVSIPRDYYVHFAGTSPKSYPDKLTHAGTTGGVQLSMATISELLDLELSQYFRVNFNFVRNLVDAIDGINIYNDQSHSFTCWTNHSCIFKPGYNYVYGDCALAFARERHAYEQGDRHRGENQQQVIKLTLDKITSSSTLISRYSEILESLVGTFETTLTQENITDLIKMHVSDMTPWVVETYNLDGTSGMAPTYSYPTQELSVMYPDEKTIEVAKHKIAVAMGLESADAKPSTTESTDKDK